MITSTATTSALNPSAKHFNVAIIGGGITGASAASILASIHHNYNHDHDHDNKNKRIEPVLMNTELNQKLKNGNIHINVDLFDQGRNNVGGRSNTRIVKTGENGIDSNDDIMMQWDHGCQFFRADTPRFQKVVSDWMAKDLISEWKGDFISSSKNSTKSSNCNIDSFFGFPSLPPFYIGNNGMSSIPSGLLNHISSMESTSNNRSINIFKGTRVAQMKRDEKSNKWFLYGVDGMAAYHDTPNKVVHELNQEDNILQEYGYDAVLLTDVSSSFGKWHRASAGVPEDFASRVRERVGSRVPLFTAMIAFDKNETDDGSSSSSYNIPFDAASFDNNDTLWFAAKTNSKLENNINPQKECWTLVSTPDYALKKIEETPMQNPKTGEFIPQSKDYLLSVPGTDLKNAFLKELSSKDGILGDGNHSIMNPDDMPKVIHMDAQRWGSAMPSHRHLDESSDTRRVVCGVPYDIGKAPLAPTKLERKQKSDVTGGHFLSDESLMLYQAGDMMSSYTPGFESASLSGMDAAESILNALYERNSLV